MFDFELCLCFSSHFCKLCTIVSSARCGNTPGARVSLSCGIIMWMAIIFRGWGLFLFFFFFLCGHKGPPQSNYCGYSLYRTRQGLWCYLLSFYLWLLRAFLVQFLFPLVNKFVNLLAVLYYCVYVGKTLSQYLVSFNL